MITPGAIVGDVDAFLAFGSGRHEAAVRIEDGAVEESIGLPRMFTKCHPCQLKQLSAELLAVVGV